jgi:hypothetical protein
MTNMASPSTHALLVLEWRKTYGVGSGRSVQVTPDGGYIITGYTGSDAPGSDSDVYLVKTDASGNMQWNKTYGGAERDEGYSMQVTGDGGYIISGSTLSFSVNGLHDVYLVKTDSTGNMQWQKTYGGRGDDFGYSMQVTPDGGYIIAGETFQYGTGMEDILLVKTDASGNEMWNRTIGGTVDYSGWSVDVTSDGGYVVAGNTGLNEPSQTDVLLVKTNSTGDVQWLRTFGGRGNEAGFSVRQTSDGGYIIAGVTDSFGIGSYNGSYNVYLVKTDSSGKMQWQRTYGGTRARARTLGKIAFQADVQKPSGILPFSSTMNS